MTPYPKPEPRPKKQPMPLKRTQLPQGPSSRQAAKIRAYEVGKREKYSEADGPTICTGCGRNEGMSCSHLVGRARSFDLIDEPSNHESQCFACHEATESGRFFQLKNGLALLERLWDGLGVMGRQRFWQSLYQWPQNRDLWQHSSFYDKEIHDII